MLKLLPETKTSSLERRKINEIIEQVNKLTEAQQKLATLSERLNNKNITAFFGLGPEANPG